MSISHEIISTSGKCTHILPFSFLAPSLTVYRIFVKSYPAWISVSYEYIISDFVKGIDLPNNFRSLLSDFTVVHLTSCVDSFPIFSNVSFVVLLSVEKYCFATKVPPAIAIITIIITIYLILNFFFFSFVICRLSSVYNCNPIIYFLISDIWYHFILYSTT